MSSLSREIGNVLINAMSLDVSAVNNSDSDSELFNFRRTFTVEIYTNRSLIMIFHQIKYFWLALSYVHFAGYIKMDEYLTPEFYKSKFISSNSLLDKPL